MIRVDICTDLRVSFEMKLCQELTRTLDICYQYLVESLLQVDKINKDIVIKLAVLL